MKIDQLLMCDFHDARIARIDLRSSGDCEIIFSSLICYCAIATHNDRADVWSGRGSLSLQRCESIVFSQVSSCELWVSDAEFAYTTSDPNDMYNLPLLDGKSLVTAAISFTNAGRMQITGGSAKLHLAKFDHRVEQCPWP